MNKKTAQQLIIGTWDLHPHPEGTYLHYTFTNQTWLHDPNDARYSDNGNYLIIEQNNRLLLQGLSEYSELELFDITEKCMVWLAESVFYVLVRI